MVATVLLATACMDQGDETADDAVAGDATAIERDTAMIDPVTGATTDPNASPPTGPDGAATTEPNAGRTDTPGADARPDPPASDDPDAPDAPADDPPDDTGDVAAAIPSRFHGEWNADLDACGTGANATRLRISANQLRFYESVGAVREVDVQSDRVVTVTAEFHGEGDTWQDERTLSLSSDGSSLTVSGGGDLVRHRCP